MGLADFVVNTVEKGLGLGLEDYVLVLALFTGFIFSALDVRIGILLTFVLISGLYLVAGALGFATGKFIAVILILVVLMSLSLFISHQRTRTAIA